jgi:hypothetical protein
VSECETELSLRESGPVGFAARDHSRRHALVLSRFILDEVERVLLYPRLQARYRITASEAARFTASLADVAQMVSPSLSVR